MGVDTRTEHVGVLGAGTMGTGVAHTLAMAGIHVTLMDISPAALDGARVAITDNARLYPMLLRDRDHPPAADILARIDFTTSVESMSHVSYVIENITENWSLKEEVYRRISEICRPECVFGVNTSAIPITKIAAVTDRADRVVGTHFMNPVPLKPLVEVIRGRETSDQTVELIRALLRRAGKDSVVVGDSSGFVTNRVAMLTVNEAVLLLQEGISTAPDIDRLFRQCLGHQMGPLETADLIGLDTVMYSLEVLHDNLKDPKFRPAPLLCELVAAGRLGRKSGQGFHSYHGENARSPQ